MDEAPFREYAQKFRVVGIHGYCLKDAARRSAVGVTGPARDSTAEQRHGPRAVQGRCCHRCVATAIVSGGLDGTGVGGRRRWHGCSLAIRVLTTRPPSHSANGSRSRGSKRFSWTSIPTAAWWPGNDGKRR